MILKWMFSLLLLFGLPQVWSFNDNDLTAEIPAGRKECYYQTTKSGHTLEIEYQVIDGGDLDIDFKISGPKGNPIVTEFRRNDGVHTVEPTEEGDYEICFDNSFSRVTKKSVFFEIIVDSGEDDLDEDGDWKQFVSPDENYGDKLVALELGEDWQQSFSNRAYRNETISEIKNNNAKVIQMQAALRAHESKDRSLAERNFTKVNFWSVVNILILLLVFGVQVFTIRSMFDDKRKVRT